MNSAITPEVMGLETQIYEESPMTEQEEKELVIVKTKIKVAYADKLERDLAIGAGLLQIFRGKLYRGVNGGRTWETWLVDESQELTGGRGAIAQDTAKYLRGFYQFRCEILQPQGTCPAGIPMPSSPAQIRPLLGQLDTHPQAALAIWEGACAQVGRDKVPTFDQVNRAALAYKANEANEARRLSAAQQSAQQRATSTSAANRRDAAEDQYLRANPEQYIEDVKSMANHAAREDCEPLPYPEPARDYSPQPTTPTIPAWELEKGDSVLDAGVECKRITLAINDAHKAIGMLRGILYSQINTYGRDYLGVLRQVDAGVYSLHNIDDQVQQMGEDIQFIFELLTADVGEGELARSTIEAVAFPTRA